jgi:hypothetical protein
MGVELCDNCARPDERLASVQRVYLVLSTPPEAADSYAISLTQRPEPPEQILDDIERWCMSCRTQYPHLELPVD